MKMVYQSDLEVTEMTEKSNKVTLKGYEFTTLGFNIETQNTFQNRELRLKILQTIPTRSSPTIELPLLGSKNGLDQVTI